MRKWTDVAGQRFGQLVAQWPDGKSCKSGTVVWTCLCDCGNIRHERVSRLLSGQTISCAPCSYTRQSDATKTHGMWNTREYRSYQSARSRCLSPSMPSFPYYGGRGIEFRFKSFEQFFECLGFRPAGMSLDRIKTEGHYEPGNVRWATAKDQALNRRPRVQN